MPLSSLVMSARPGQYWGPPSCLDGDPYGGQHVGVYPPWCGLANECTKVATCGRTRICFLGREVDLYIYL